MGKKINLAKIVNSTVNEESDSLEYDEERKDEEEVKNIEERDEGDWESELSDMAPLKGRKRVSLSAQLPNGLTPYEMMYGKQEDDYDIIGKSLE